METRRIRLWLRDAGAIYVVVLAALLALIMARVPGLDDQGRVERVVAERGAVERGEQEPSAVPADAVVEADPELREELARWQAEATYFAAFAVGEGGHFGWTSEYNSLHAAVTDALAFCVVAGVPCRVTETREPREGGALKGSEGMLAAHAEFQGRPAPKAFAISENGAWSMNWAARNRDVARRKALKDCNARSALDQPEFLPDWPCRLVD